MKENRSFEDVIDFVSEYMGMPIEAIISTCRRQEFIEARMYSYYLCCKHTKLSLSSMGRLMGGRTHATVLNSLKRIYGFMEVDSEFKKKIETLENIFIGDKNSELGGVTKTFLQKILNGGFEKNDYYYSKLKYVSSVLNQQIQRHEDNTR